MARAALVGNHLAVGHQRQHIPGFQADVLDPLVAGDLVGHVTDAVRKFGLQCAGLVPQPEVLEGIVECLFDFLHLRVVRIHQRQFLLVHQHAGGDRRHQVIAPVNQLGQYRDVGLFQGINGVQVAQLQLRHAAALFLGHHIDVNVVMLKHPHEVFAHLGTVVVAVAGGIERNFARGLADGSRFNGLDQWRHPLAQGFGVHAGQRRFMVDVQGLLHHLAEPCILVQRVDRDVHQGYRHDAQHGVGAGQGFVTQVAALFLEFDGLGSQH